MPVDQEIQVVSLEGLKKMKRIAGRPQDLADLDYLEQADRNESRENG
jgi:hypothetical protein